MANIPLGATLIDNPVSGAPGFKMENVFVLAGVPRIMRDMFEGCESHLARGAIVKSLTVIAYLAEGVIAEPLRKLQTEYSEVEIGSYPFYTEGRFGTNLVLRSTEESHLSAAGKKVADMVRSLGADPQIE